LRLPVRDISGAFRCYRVAQLPALLAGPIHAQGYAFFEEVLWRLRRQGARIVEIPYVFRDRTLGQSKLNWGEACAALGLILWLAGAERGWYVERAKHPAVR
jgi:dolichol-phosphate mannosyltransferase